MASRAQDGGTTGASELSHSLAEVGRALHARGWALGTAGNFSAVRAREPLRLLISRSGVDKGELQPDEIVEVDESGALVSGDGRPSDETVVHIEIVRARGAGAVLHTHSVWNTLLSEAEGDAHGIALQGFEMLKGLSGVKTHEHVEWLPILENTQDYVEMARGVRKSLDAAPEAHGLLLRGHGLYAWGDDLKEAKRHVEVLEFLLEVSGRIHQSTGRLRAPRLAADARRAR